MLTPFVINDLILYQYSCGNTKCALRFLRCFIASIQLLSCKYFQKALLVQTRKKVSLKTVSHKNYSNKKIPAFSGRDSH